MKKLTLAGHEQGQDTVVVIVSQTYIYKDGTVRVTKSERRPVEGGVGLIGDTRAASPSLIAPPPPLLSRVDLAAACFIKVQTSLCFGPMSFDIEVCEV